MSSVRPDQVLHFASGLAAIVVGGVSLCTGDDRNVAVLLASLFLLVIVITDTLYRKIHNLSSILLILCGLAWQMHSHGAFGLWLALLGLVTGLTLLLPFYLLGGMGAGDVKALAALGALTGLTGILQIFLYTALIGGVLSILHYCFTTNLWQKSLAGINTLQTFLYTRDIHCLKPNPDRERQSLPYAAAIALGFFAFVQWGPIVTLPQ